MNKSYYKKASLSLFDAINSNNFDNIDKFTAEDIKLDFPGTKLITGRKKLIVFMKIMIRKFSGLNFNVYDIITEENKTCVFWTNSGKYPDGNEYKNSGMTLIHFKDEKIIFLSDYFKNTSFIEK